MVCRLVGAFRVRDDVELLAKIIAQGETVMTDLNPIAQKSAENATTSCHESAQQFGAFCNDKSAEIQPCTINHKINKSKDNNLNLSIAPRDMIDRTDISPKSFSLDERNDYLEIIRENIEYDCFSEKGRVDELVEIMLDVVCSTKITVRVNGEDLPHEVVKSRFLKLNHEHIDYVLTALQKNTSEVRNIRAYLITALYNAPTTNNSYYTAWVNHDMHGSA